jgi:integrase
MMQITSATLQSYKVGISAPLEFAIDRNFIEGPNPCTGIKVERWCVPVDKLKIPSKRPFSIDELKRVFEHPWFVGVKSNSKSYEKGDVLLKDMRYWAPVLAAHTGMRAAELAGLEINDVKLEHEYPHVHLKPNKYRRTKNGEERYIPLLDVLIELGFVEYLNKLVKKGESRVFPDWHYPGNNDVKSEKSAGWANAKWIRAFNRMVIGKTFKDDFQDFDRAPISFHSFRGSFKTLLSKSHPGLLTNAVVGHYQDDLDRAYISEQMPADLFPQFHSLRYGELKIPGRKSRDILIKQ